MSTTSGGETSGVETDSRDYDSSFTRYYTTYETDVWYEVSFHTPIGWSPPTRDLLYNETDPVKSVEYRITRE